MNQEQADAFRRAGMAGRQELLCEEGGSASLAEASRLLGVAETEVLTMAAQDDLFVVKNEHGLVCCPRWQFDGRGHLLPGLRLALRTLKRSPGFSEVAPLVFFLQSHPRTSGRPLDALRAGDIESVVSAAAQESD